MGLISTLSTSATNLVVGVAAVSDELVGASLAVASIARTTAEYGQASNAAWAARGMSDYSDEDRAYIAMIAPDLALPPAKAG